MIDFKKKHKTIILVILGTILSISTTCLLLSIFPRPCEEQELHIGDKIYGYRNMNRWKTFSCLISLNKVDDQYEIKFVQYYDNNAYEFTYNLCQEDFIYLYYDKLPANQIELKIYVNESNNSIIIKNEDLINRKMIKEEKKKLKKSNKTKQP